MVYTNEDIAKRIEELGAEVVSLKTELNKVGGVIEDQKMSEWEDDHKLIKAYEDGYSKGRADGIDEFFNELQKAFLYYYDTKKDDYEISEIVRNKMLEQIKEQKNEM